jgi:hypothetical protein
MKFLIGCDPEVFVKQNGIFKSAYGLIAGDKKNPQKIRNGAVQVDGMALEFNIDPAHSEDQFAMNVQDVYEQMRLMVPDFEIVATPVAHFDKEYLKSQPKEAIELGCDPDYNAWTGAVNDKPDCERPMRTASGHVHIGWTDGQDIANPGHIGMVFAAMKQMDFYLGLPSLMYDKDTERREMYGKSGCCRIKPYGGEYRTLSNAWLQSEKLMRLVYRNAVKGMEALVSGTRLVEKYGDIQEIINNTDVKEAKKIIVAEDIEVMYGCN